MNQERTYGWYTTVDFDHGVPYDTTKYHGINAPGHRTNQTNLEILGVLNQVPTLDNIRPLIDTYVDWYKLVDQDTYVDWYKLVDQENLYKEQDGKPLVTLHWILNVILKDPTIDVRIIRYALETYSKFTIVCVSNPSCPEDVIIELLNRKPKDDPTNHTKGGEVSCFLLQNRSLSSHLVDLCARKSKKVSNQRSCVDHPNVSRDTLVFLSREGRSPSVKRDALEKLVERGWLTVK